MKFDVHLKDVEVFEDEEFGRGFDFHREWYEAIELLPNKTQKFNLFHMINTYFFDNKLPENDNSSEYKLFMEMLG